MITSKLLKLARLVINLAEISTDKGVLIIDGEPEIGKEVFVEDENGDLIAPADGEYFAEDKVYSIADGKIVNIEDRNPETKQDPEPESDPEPEPEPEPEVLNQEDQEPENEPEQPAENSEDKIAELEAKINELNNIIAEKDEEIGALKAEIEKANGENEELKSQLKMSSEKPAEEKLKEQENKNNDGFVFKPRF